MIATLVSLEPVPVEGDSVVTREQLKDALADLSTDVVIIRTLPNPETKKTMDYSGTNPAYLEGEAASWLNEKGVKHLLLDLPSVDREEDGGALAAHKAFWGIKGRPRYTATITECIYVPDRFQDGTYLLNLQMAAFVNDASPSRPLLFPIWPSGEETNQDFNNP
jgi:kynurenine formamidase